MTWRRELLGVSLLAAVACGGGAAIRPGGVLPGSTNAASTDSMWSTALQHFRHGKWSKAAIEFELATSVMTPGDARVLQGRFFIGETQFARGEQLLAVRTFRRIADENAGSELAPVALLRAGDAYADLWRRPELDPTYGRTGAVVYREVTERFPGTTAARQASLRLADLNERFAFKAFRTALFYLRFKAYNSAILTLRNLVTDYPRSSTAPKALLKMVEAYHKLGYVEDQRETCTYIRQQYPEAPGVHRACPEPDAAP